MFIKHIKVPRIPIWFRGIQNSWYWTWSSFEFVRIRSTAIGIPISKVTGFAYRSAYALHCKHIQIYKKSVNRRRRKNLENIYTIFAKDSDLSWVMMHRPSLVTVIVYFIWSYLTFDNNEVMNDITWWGWTQAHP